MYIFETTTAMKPYNCKKYWIADDIVPIYKSSSEGIQDALRDFAVFASDYGITISRNALKHPHKMYHDTPAGDPEVCGVVLTASTEFDTDYVGYTKQFIDLWINIDTVIDTDYDDLF